MKKTIFLIFLSFTSLVLLAQTVQLKGTVKDAKTGELLIGVNIIVEGSQTGTVTDLDGNFVISAPADGTLKISYIGYKTQQVKFSGQKMLDIQLESDSKTIDEIVVVGYSVQKKRDVLGAISKVGSNELSKIPVASAQQALQGRIAGVNVAAQTGAPGAPISVRIRGVNSIGLGNEPLYIVDGIPIEGALNNIPPGEIETMTVLKDASSAAIYGSRATNGVILITTKSGKSGDAKITYNTQIGFQTHGRLTKMASTDQYIKLYNEAATADNKGSIVQRSLIDGNWVKDFPNVSHIDEIFQTAPLQLHELSISGGNEKTTYLISAAYYNQDGIIKNTGYQRANVRSNISSDVKKWLQVGLNVSGSISNNRLVSSSGDGSAGEGGSVVRYALYRNPAIPVYNAAGNYVDLPSEYYGDAVYNSFFGDGYSPEGLAANTDRTKKIKTLLATGNVLVKFTPDLLWKTTAGIDYNVTDKREYNKTWGTANRINSTNGLNISSEGSSNWTINSTLNYSVNWNENSNLSALVGTEAVKQTANGLYLSDSQFANTDPDFLYIGKGLGTKTGNQSEWGSSLLSFFGNVNYNYKQKYYVSGILRRDGSSRFSDGHKWGTFYSVSAGWNLDSEDFIKDLSDINKLKLRAGYGSIGNQNIPLYSYYDRYGSQYYYTFGGTSYNGYAQTTLGNIDLKWETNNQFNAGIDLEMQKGTWGATLDYYYKITNDMLLPASYPPSVGKASPPYINSKGNVLNTGVDIEVFYRKQYKDVGFTITLNGGFLHNEVLNIDAPYYAGTVDTGISATKTDVGQPIGSFYLYKMDGIFQNEAEILTSAYQGKNIKPGDVKYVDINNDNVIDAKDRDFAGSAIPVINAGLNLS
jgi:TonB-linked SusC/RagA family outer membrane protein